LNRAAPLAASFKAQAAMMADRLTNKRGRQTWHGLIHYGSNRNAARLLRPPAIVPNVGAIHPRNRPAFDTACGALQCVVCNIDSENYLVTLDAISHVMVHGTIPLSLWCHLQ
jgi:hypothetical protein